MTFLKRNPFAGLVFGVLLVAVGLFTLPIISEAADGAATAANAECRVSRVQFDDGYGLAPPVERRACR